MTDQEAIKELLRIIDDKIGQGVHFRIVDRQTINEIRRHFNASDQSKN